MPLFDMPDKFRVEVETRNKIIEEVDKELTIINQKKAEEAKYIESDEYKEKLRKEKEAYSRKWVFEFFKELHPDHREMKEEEYQEYMSILKDPNTKPNYSILMFINKADPIIRNKQEQHDMIEIFKQ